VVHAETITITLTGKLGVVIGHSTVAASPNSFEYTEYTLFTNNGLQTPLFLDEELLKPFGGAYATKSKRLLVTGQYLGSANSAHPKVTALFKVESIRLENPDIPSSNAPFGEQFGSKPFINILCNTKSA
jgi:hypothetical protein